MKEELVEALDEIAGAFCRILDEPDFKFDKPPLTFDVEGLRRFFRQGFSNHSSEEILEALRDAHRRNPYNFTGLIEGFEKLRQIRDFRDSREGSLFYRVALAPIFLPKVTGILGLLKFSNRDVQWGFYYSTLGIVALLGAWLFSWLNPAWIPGLVSWCLLSEFVERDLEIEEALRSNCLFALMVMSGNVERLLEVCRDRGIELGKLFAAGDQITLEVSWDSLERSADLNLGFSEGVPFDLDADLADPLGMEPVATPAFSVESLTRRAGPMVLPDPDDDEVESSPAIQTLSRILYRGLDQGISCISFVSPDSSAWKHAREGQMSLALVNPGDFGVIARRDGAWVKITTVDSEHHDQLRLVLATLAGTNSEWSAVSAFGDESSGYGDLVVAGRSYRVKATFPGFGTGRDLSLSFQLASQRPLEFTSLGLAALPRALLWSSLTSHLGSTESSESTGSVGYGPVIVIVSPEGSGRTTTLYSLARALQTSGMTPFLIEHRIEYPMEGVSQVMRATAPDPSAPDVIQTVCELGPRVILVDDLDHPRLARVLFDEVPPEMTQVIAIRGTDPADALRSLVSWGITEEEIQHRVKLIVHQEIVPRACMACRREMGQEDSVAVRSRHRVSLEQEWALAEDILKDAGVWRSVGCALCRDGIRGETAVFEITVPSPEHLQTPPGTWFFQDRADQAAQTPGLLTSALLASLTGRIPISAVENLKSHLAGVLSNRSSEPGP